MLAKVKTNINKLLLINKFYENNLSHFINSK